MKYIWLVIIMIAIMLSPQLTIQHDNVYAAKKNLETVKLIAEIKETETKIWRVIDYDIGEVCWVANSELHGHVVSMVCKDYKFDE